MPRLFRMLTGPLSVALMILMASPAWAQLADWFDANWQCRRKLSVVVPENLPVERLTGVATFLTFGALKPDGADLRVMLAGRELPSRILQVGPGDQVTVAFALVPNQNTYFVYFGNPKAGAPAEPLDLKAGLLLEVRSLPGGPYENLNQVRDLFSRAKHTEGAAFVDNVFSGFNPFGPPDNFVERYSGFLRIADSGRYTFAASSTHNSFLLVDGKLVVACRAREGPPGRARFTGTLRLEEGVHPFEYYHVHTWGDPVAVAAWQLPRSDKFVPIPSEAFIPVTRAVVGPLQRSQDRITPDFTFARSEAVLTPDGLTCLERFRFVDRTAAVNHTNYTVEWNFGDGVTSNSWEPAHVYLADGPVKVTLTVQGPLGKGASAQQLVIGRNWASQTGPGVDELKDYYDLVRAYDFSVMPTSHLVRAAYFFERLDKYPDMVAVSRRLVFDRKDLSPGDRAERGLAVVDVLRNKLHDRADALAFLRQLEQDSSSDDLKARFALITGEISLEDLAEHARPAERLDQVRAIFNRVLTSYRKAGDESSRRALVGLGDVAWFAHDAASVADFYQRAERIPIRGSAALRQPVRSGYLARTIEEMLRDGELDSAEESLKQWEWERPSDRLVGYSAVLRARLLIARKQFDQAQRHLEAFIAISPRSLYAPEALLLLANCLQAQERLPEAARALRKLLVDYPESELKAQAAKRLKTLEP